MKHLSGNEIRRKFLDYFVSQGHRQVSSFPLVPGDDPTFLFTNAGMVQFKDVFTGSRKVDYTRATTAQKCLRVSGKHNDLENVGRTPRHHTFFEMLGNFSFGDYFKEEAIRYAWELMTEGYGLPAERLLVTIFRDDDEAERLWREKIGVPAERIVRHDEKDNFWSMGETGPCGPCSEIHWDRGPEFGPDPDTRYTELWNQVFMQFARTADGVLHPLPRPSIDTGAGLERIAAVLQGVQSNYDTDLFRGIIARVEQVSGRRYGDHPEHDTSMRVIADHARAAAFLIAEGVFPENEGRGYVLRRLMRRAIRHGTLLGLQELFFHEACLAVIDSFGDHYAELRDGQPAIVQVAQQEEEQFRRTLGRGLELIAAWHGGPDGQRQMPGELAFRLYDTYGFPLDLTEVIAAERGFTVDLAGFEQAMAAQRERGRQSWKGASEERKAVYEALRTRLGETRFVGYDQEQLSGEPVLALLQGGVEVTAVRAPAELELVTAATPFYAESGGQVGDSGTVRAEGLLARVQDTVKPVPGLVVHRLQLLEGDLAPGRPVDLEIDRERRQATRRNHSATHLLHFALRKVLGSHVRQKGSLVTPDKLRFDFAHFQPMTPDELNRVERLANELALENEDATTQQMDLEAALQRGALAFFEDKYGDRVRVVQIGRSTELCGGTHVRRAGDIGAIRILAETGIAAGVRRLEAVTGLGTVELAQRTGGLLGQVSEQLRTPPEEVPERIERLQRQLKDLERELATVKGKLAATSLDGLLANARDLGTARVVAAEVRGLDGDALLALGDRLREALGSGTLLLALGEPGKVQLLCMVTADLVGKLHAGNLVREVARLVGGGGGGAPHMAKAGGKDPAGIPAALDRFHVLAKEALSG